MFYTYPQPPALSAMARPDAEAKPVAPKLPAAGGQPPPEPEPPTQMTSFLVGPEDDQQPGKGYPLKVVAEQAENDAEVMAALVWYCFVHPRTQMFLVKKEWGAPHGLAPEAVLLEDANGTSLSDGSIPEEMGWTIASRGDPPVCTVYALPKFDEHAHNPQVKAGRPICARPLAAENLAVPPLAPA